MIFTSLQKTSDGSDVMEAMEVSPPFHYRSEEVSTPDIFVTLLKKLQKMAKSMPSRDIWRTWWHFFQTGHHGDRKKLSKGNIYDGQAVREKNSRYNFLNFFNVKLKIPPRPKLHNSVWREKIDISNVSPLLMEILFHKSSPGNVFFWSTTVPVLFGS